MAHTLLCTVYGCACTEEELLKHEAEELRSEITRLEHTEKVIKERLPEAKKRLASIESALANPVVETVEAVSYAV